MSGTSGKCSSNPCPAGYECADVLQGFQCKCVDSSKCDLETPICQDTSCITGMEYFSCVMFFGQCNIPNRFDVSLDMVHSLLL